MFAEGSSARSKHVEQQGSGWDALPNGPPSALPKTVLACGMLGGVCTDACCPAAVVLGSLPLFPPATCGVFGCALDWFLADASAADVGKPEPARKQDAS